MKDGDIDSLSADGAQDTRRMAGEWDENWSDPAFTIGGVPAPSEPRTAAMTDRRDRPQTVVDDDYNARYHAAPSEPRTAAGRQLLESWRLIDEYGPPNARVIGDAILAIEAEAAAPAGLDVEALARAIEAWAGPGSGRVRVAFSLSRRHEVARGLARHYARLRERQP